jgi:hypothetical protein
MIALVIAEPSFTIFDPSIKVVPPYYLMALNEIPPQLISLNVAFK